MKFEIETPFGKAEYLTDGAEYVELRFKKNLHVGRCALMDGTVTLRKHNKVRYNSRIGNLQGWDYTWFLYRAKGFLVDLTHAQSRAVRENVLPWMADELVLKKLYWETAAMDVRKQKIQSLKKDIEHKAAELEGLKTELKQLEAL